MKNITVWNTRGFKSPEKVICYKTLIRTHNLDILCTLENIINISSLDDPWFCASHRLFEYESSCNNFAYASFSRIWLKWNYYTVNFIVISMTNQHVSRFLNIANMEQLFVSFVYASNSGSRRLDLWNDLACCAYSINMP